MEPSNLNAEEIKELKRKLQLKYRILDLLRKVLGLQTKLDKLKWEAVARRIAQEYQLDEDVFVAVLYCESGMNPKAINRNKNGTTDYGIAQFNDHWYREIIHPQDALNQPEVALNVMAKQWQNGRQSNWICFRNARYIAFL